LQYKNKKNLYKIVFIVILLSFIISLVGCNWLSLGLLNIFDPQAQIRVDYRLDNLTAEGISNIWFTIFSLNEAEFIGEQFLFEYYNEGIKIPELSRTIGATFYVPPSPLSSFENPVSIPKETEPGFPVYFQDVIDYMTLHPLIVEVTSTITVMGTDGAGHSISKTIAFNLPTILPGIDFEPPVAVINVTPSTTGTAPFTVVFDAYSSTDNRGIASYSWDFGDGTTGTGVMPPAHTYSKCGTYVVKLTVTDYWGLKGYATVIINVGETGGPKVVIKVTPGTSGTAPFTVYFDASGTTFATGCGVGTATYSWNFGDGSALGTGVTTSHTYTSNGVYTVILTVTDSAGNIGYGSVTIILKEAGIPAEIILQAIPTTVTAGGGTSQIIATVKDSAGDPVPNGTAVTFNTTFGSLSSYSETTVNGIATTVLTLSGEGSATVTAISGSISKSVIVTCPPAP